MIGRERELAEVLRRVEEVRAGQGAVVFIAGEAGIGKTVLAEAALEESGLRVFAARAVRDFAPPYRLVMDVLNAWRAGFPEEFARLGPVAVQLGPLMADTGWAGAAVSEGELLEALEAAFLSVGRARASAVLFDDLQASDAATLDLLRIVAHRIRETPVLLIGTYDPAGAQGDHPIRRLRASLRKTRRFTELTLDPLGPGDTMRLMGAWLGGEPHLSLAQMLHERCQGIPLFLEELCKTLTGGRLVQAGEKGIELTPGRDVPVPEGIRDAVAVQLATLSPAARALLEAAAVAGAEFDLAEVTSRAGGEEGLEELVDHRFVRELDARRGGFVRALIREAVLSEMTWSRRRALNRAAAESLAAAGAAPERLIPHFLEAGDTTRARRALIELAERAGILYLELFTAWALAQLEVFEGNLEDAGGRFRRLLDVWETTDDRHEVLPGLRAAATFFADRGLPTEAGRCAAIAGRIVAASGNPEAAATLSFTLGEAGCAQGEVEDGVNHFARAHDLLCRHELAVDGMNAGARLGEVLLQADRVEEGVRRLRQTLAIARRLGARPLAGRIENALQAVAAVGGDAGEGFDPGAWERLSRRQQDVARLLAEGLTNKEIAIALGLSPRTVDMHMQHIFDRLDCRTRTEVVRRLVHARMPAA